MSHPHEDLQAFPAAWGDYERGGDYVKGMTLRDWFAGQALSGLLAHASGEDPHKAPEMAFIIADAMIRLGAQEKPE